MNCLNCEEEFRGAYCPACGQKSSTKRLTVINVLHDFLSALSDSNKGFLKTLIDLSQNPGQMINNYISGRRSRYLSAGKYAFLMIVLFTVTISFIESSNGIFESLVTNIKIYGEDSDISQIGDVNLDFSFMDKPIKKKVTKHEFMVFLQKMVPEYHRTLFDLLKFLIVLWIPIAAFFSYFCFFRASYNVAEHIAFNAYVFSQGLLIFLFLAPMYWFLPEKSGLTSILAFISALFYFFYAYMQFFTMRPKVLIKTILSLSLSIFAYSTVALTFLMSLGFYIVYQNIDRL